MTTNAPRLALAAAALILAALVSPSSAGTVTCTPSPVEIVFAVDISSSLSRPDFANLKLFLQSMAEHLPIGPTQTRPAVISFSTGVKVEIDLGDADDLKSFKNGVDSIPYYRGFTATGAAMQTARRTVFPKSRSGASKLLVVVTDGRANYPGSREEAIALVKSESADLRGQGVRIHAIGIGEVWLRDELALIAGSDDYSMINDFGGLKALVDTLVKDICSVTCDSLGQESFPGQCFSGTQRIVHVDSVHNKALNRCEKSITHEYKYCGPTNVPDRQVAALFQVVIGTDLPCNCYTWIRTEIFQSQMDATYAGLQYDAFKISGDEDVTKATLYGLVSGSYPRRVVLPQPVQEMILFTPTDTISAQAGNSHLCKDVNVAVGDCSNGVREVETTWEDFDVKLQKCVLKRSVQHMDCNTIEECKEPVAEILYILDSSGSMSDQDWRMQVSFVHRMVTNMKVGPGAIHIGVIVFGTDVWNDIPMGSVGDKPTLLQRILGLQRRVNQWTNTGGGIRMAKAEFLRLSRPGVTRMAILMTDGGSNCAGGTCAATLTGDAIQEASKLEADGATIFVIGVGAGLKKEELQAIATPPLTDHLFYATDFDKLLNWASKISDETCKSITPPDPSLCELPPKRVVSSCYNSLQKVTEIKYEYDAQGRCTKKLLSHTTSPCKVVCTDPINGNEYYDGETWKTQCASFLCRRPTSQTEIFKPTAIECHGADSKCFATSSTDNFKCHDDRGQLYGHCNCQAQNGNPLLRVITADANAKP